MTEIVTPFAQFFDTNGAPLNNGAIFIGTAYLDAQTNPIPVYWDDALTIPALQPIRTLNGYAVWNGAPARIFCNADNFSMTVQTSTGRTVWAVQDATSENKTSDMIFSDFAAPNGSSLVGFIAAGANADARTAEDKMRDIVSVKDFGAIGDGVTDDTAAFNAAFAALISGGGGELFVSPGTYRLSSLISITCNAQQHIRLRGSGRYVSTLDFGGSPNLGLYFNSTSTAANYLPTFEVCDIGLVTSRDNAGNALRFNYASSANIDASILVRDVFIGQNVKRTADSGIGFGYWSFGIYCTNTRAGEISNLHFYGEIDKSPKTSHGIYLDGETTEFIIDKCNIFEAGTGIEAAGTCEGVYINNTVITQVRYGVRHNIAAGLEPQLIFSNGHINASEVCVWGTNSSQSVVDGSLFYANTYYANPGPWPAWTGVIFDGLNSAFNTVNACTFTKEGGRTGDTTTGIDLNAGRQYVISACQFFGFGGNPLTYGVQIRTGVNDVRVSADCAFENVTGPVANLGARSIRQPVIQRGFAVVASGDAISFPQAFNSQPIVVASHLGSSTSSSVSVDTFTATSFKAYHAFGGSVAVSWIAVGD
jgi:hypothetical protein